MKIWHFFSTNTRNQFSRLTVWPFPPQKKLTFTSKFYSNITKVDNELQILKEVQTCTIFILIKKLNVCELSSFLVGLYFIHITIAQDIYPAAVLVERLSRRTATDMSLRPYNEHRLFVRLP